MDGEDAADGPVFEPDELDIEDNERVERLAENRYVVAADDDGPSTPDDGGGEADRRPAKSAEKPEIDGEAVAEWLEQSLSNDGFDYGFDATIKFDGEVDRHRMVSNDVVAAFETLLLWYGRQASGETDVAEVLGLLLAESEVPVRLPQPALRAACERHDLSPEDSVADLVAAADDGFLVGSR